MKKFFKVGTSILLSAILMAGCATAKKDNQEAANKDDSQQVNAQEEKVDINIASLKGPTTMGMVKLMKDSEDGSTFDKYNVAMSGTADEIVPKIVKGEIDMAAVPCNLASVLYNKTNGGITIAAVNTLGVLYVVENGNAINSVEDLKGKTIYTTGKGTTPEYVLNYVLKENGINPDSDVTIEYKSEATEVAAVLSQDNTAIAMLPQPFVTTGQMKNENLRIARDMTKEWDKLQGNNGSGLVTGVVVVRNEFLKDNEEAVNRFLSEYQKSTEYVNGNLEEAAKLIEGYDIVPAAVAKKAVPLCNITFLSGDEMKAKVSGYLKVLYDQNPESVGGKLPEDNFYYQYVK